MAVIICITFMFDMYPRLIMVQEDVICEGPIDGSVLGAYQEFHRSHFIWQNNVSSHFSFREIVVYSYTLYVKVASPSITICLFLQGEPLVDCEPVVIQRNEASLKRMDPPTPPVLALIR